MTDHDPARHRPTVNSGHAGFPERDAAFSAFYHEFLKPLVAHLLLQGANLVDAAEIAQDAMALAYRKWPDIDHPRAWTRTVASRNFIRRKVDILETPVDPIPHPSPVLRAVDIERWEQHQDILQAVADLPHRQRQVIALYLDDHSTATIARELDISQGAVREHLHRARKALGARLAISDGDQ